MHDNPEPTEEEQEQVPEHLEEEDAKKAPGHENPEAVLEEDRDA
jgi:hypothetical protein